MPGRLPEVWLRGPVPGIPPQLQPVAHALLQAREELGEILQDFPDAELWTRPAGLASVGFHLQHLSGVLDRLFTYARGEALSPAQFQALKSEGAPRSAADTAESLRAAFSRQLDLALAELRGSDPDRLLEAREVGRARLPSTRLGLLVHAAEHTQRHIGQLLVTSRVVQQGRPA